MATAPQSRRLNLTRDQLSQFLTDQQQIRQFEMLFATVDELQVITGTDFEYQADTAAATANEALAQISALVQDTAVKDAVLNAKVQQALDAIPRLAQALELLSTAPIIENNNSVSTDYIDFNTTTPSPAVKVGRMHWNGGTTLGIQMTPNVLQRVGESSFVYVKASSAITKGQLCYHTGSVGGSGVITAAPTPLALADPNQIVGVAAESIAHNGFGLIQVSGDLRGFNTTGSSVSETWADGDALYYNPAYVGTLTKVKPSAPNQKTYVCEVITASSGASGSINIRLSPGSTLGGTDSNVQFSGLANGNIIQYDSVLGYWKNVPLSTAGAVTSVTGTSPVVSSGGSTPAISLASGYGDTQNPYASKTANYFLAAPSGSTGLPTFRAMVATDVPTLNQSTTGTASNVTGTVAIANGGTGAITAATARTNLGATTVGSNFFTLPNPSSITFARINADNSVSTLDAATFRTAIGAGTGTGSVTSVAALTLGTTGTDLSSTVANGTTTPVITLNVPTASATNRGALSASDWSSFRSTKVLTWLSM
jgi:hypothetical protein